MSNLIFIERFYYLSDKFIKDMTKFKIGDDWWTTPTSADNGNRVIVTGRRNVEPVMNSGKFTDRVEITWRYEPEKDGMPDYKTSTLMESVSDALANAFNKDQAAILTGIYTGDGERNWIFYVRNLNKFQFLINSTLSSFELLPLEIYAEKDDEWGEYNEMRSKTEIIDEE